MRDTRRSVPKNGSVSGGGVGVLAPGSGGAAGSCETSGSFIASPLAGRDYKAVIRRSELLAREISTDNWLRYSLLPVAGFDSTHWGLQEWTQIKPMLRGGRAAHHAASMKPIEIRTFRQILERNHQLASFCPVCRRWATCNLAELVANGLGDSDPGHCRPRCRKCRSIGEWQVRPPVPGFGGYGRYGMQ